MTAEEAIDNLEYLISEDCTDSQFDYVDEIEMAIEALEKVEEYKRLEEQGLLLRLPCKVGDKCYRIRKTCSASILEPKGSFFPSNHVCEDFCPRYHSGCDREYVITEYVFSTINQIISSQSVIGKHIFLTREEAEQKLKELEE